ncbi:MAG: cbb3-type cytochrome c oxidase N-terminal domain-containing protein [Mucilaginibacter sp.]|uniref:cbb3-type cytochrome c oxidase N-terminal domain-containing protein n=1 Tax=Mucilaginibacter sp. TaxID=1882438 RepID=UPI00326778D5
MNRLRYILIPLLFAQPVFADDDSALPELTTSQIMNFVGYGAIVVTLLVFIAALLVIVRAIKAMTKVMIGSEAYEKILADEAAAKVKPKKPKVNHLEKLLSLKPLSEEHTLIIAHDYDGIQELDNPTPRWFMVLFYGTIAFGVAYLLIYHVFGIGQLQYDEYKTEMAVAAKDRATYLSKSANLVDENTVKLTKDPTVITAGEAVFKSTCVACHGDHAEGKVGPNLTDDFWLHGNKVSDLFKTIKYGVPSKGMPTWEKQLTPKQISDVANFVKSIHGTNPANPKEPQGTKETDKDIAVGLKTAMLKKK